MASDVVTGSFTELSFTEWRIIIYGVDTRLSYLPSHAVCYTMYIPITCSVLYHVYPSTELYVLYLTIYFSHYVWAGKKTSLLGIGLAIDTIDYVQGIGNGPIDPLHPCPKPNTFST